MSLLYLENPAAGRPPALPSIHARRVPVRGESWQKGRNEGLWFRPFSAKERGRLLLAAERFDRTTKAQGARNGALGHVGLEVLREMTRLINFKTGRLDPAYTTIARRIQRSRSAVIAAVKRLKAYGFLDWQRRYEPTDRDGAGPQLKQASNAYRLMLPAIARRLLGWLFDAPPMDDPSSDSIKADRERYERDHFADDPLGRALKALQTAMQARESAERSETPRADSFNSPSGIAPCGR